jgi:dTDP-4-amino-4,6-dideoxygalactose transaminase
LNLAAQYKGLRKEILSTVKEVCDSQHYILGPHGAALEKDVAAYCGAEFGVGVASGTDALLLALMALGIGPGDKVITTPYSFFATVSAIARVGAEPVFADIDPQTYNIDASKVEKILKKGKKGIKAIMPVHLYGQPADMEALMALSRKYGVKIVEDAAQAIGAEYDGRRVGSIGHVGCLSFYPTKNLGGAGDGGMVTTNDKRTAEMVGMLRVHGSRDRYHHLYVGINSRLDELQAAILRVKLKRLDSWGEARIRNAARYDSLLKKAGLDAKIQLPAIAGKCKSVYNQYVIRAPKRDELKDFLGKKGIGTAIYYPLSLHMQECFKLYGYKKGDMPESERAALETLALPIYPELKPAEQKYVVDSMAEFYK